MKKKHSPWNPPYPSVKVTDVEHWLGKRIEWPRNVDLGQPDALAQCIAVLCPVYDVMIRRHSVTGHVYLYVDDFGGGFRQR